jgi:hypothetical protein
LLFTVIFGANLSLWVGFGVGYLYVLGHMKFFEVGTPKASALENKFPFKKFVQHPGKVFHFLILIIAFVSVSGA